MEYLRDLSIRNARTVDAILGSEYVELSREDKLVTDHVINANEALAESLYGQDIADLVRRNDAASLADLQAEVLVAVSAPESSLNSVDLPRLGVVIVRPEALGLANASEDLLKRSGLRIVLDKTTQIDFERYWSLYGPGLSDPESKYDFPTRTLNYINHDIRVLAVTADPDVLRSNSVSDYITNELKGRQGSFTANTLRGDIAYTALRGLVNIDSVSFTDQPANLALDPIGAYRQLVRGGVVSDRAHSTADSPLLFYAGQSMHVPNIDEIGRDLRILLSEEEIALIAEEIYRE